MAEEGGGHHPIQDVLFIVGLLLVLIVLWFVNGGPERADLKGIFLEPPPPLGTGESYGPEFGEPAPWAPTTTSEY
jgi:hypothetical protein